MKRELACLALVTSITPTALALPQCSTNTPDQGELVVSGSNDLCSGGLAPLMGPGFYSNYYVESAGFLLDDDYFEIIVSPRSTLVVDALFDDSIADIDITLYDTASQDPCVTPGDFLEQGASSDDDEQIEWTNYTTSARSVTLKVSVFFPGTELCNNYDLNVAIDRALMNCASLAEDSLDPNNTCVMAFVNPAPAWYSGRTLTSAMDDDWHAFDVPPGGRLSCDAFPTFDAGYTDIDTELWSGLNCSGTKIMDGMGGANCINWTNQSTVTQRVYHRVFIVSANDCAQYKLRIGPITTVNCTGCQSNDADEDNDTCDQATVFDDSLLRQGLTIQAGDVDWYKFDGKTDERAFVTAFFDHQCANVELELFSGPSNCNDIGDLTPLAESKTTLDYEEIIFCNRLSTGAGDPDCSSPTGPCGGNCMDLGPAPVYYVRVSVEGSGCSTYDLSASTSPTGSFLNDCGSFLTPPCTLATSYCSPAAPNSLNIPAILVVDPDNITSFGTAQAKFDISGMPPSQPGILIGGSAPALIPFGCGDLCIQASGIIRGPVFLANNLGMRDSISFDMSIAGVTHIQAWYRDPAAVGCMNGAGFNLSNALQ